MTETLVPQGLRALLLQTEFITKHGDEFPIGGLILLGGHLAAEGLVQGREASFLKHS